MKDVKIKVEFVDKYNRPNRFDVGAVVSFDDARAADIVAKGLGEFVIDTPKVVEKPAEETVAEPEQTLDLGTEEVVAEETAAPTKTRKTKKSK